MRMCTIKSSGGYVSSAWMCFESVTFSSESLPGTVLTFNQHQRTLSCHVLEQGVLKLLELNQRKACLLVKLTGIVICELWGNSVHHKCQQSKIVSHQSTPSGYNNEKPSRVFHWLWHMQILFEHHYNVTQLQCCWPLKKGSVVLSFGINDVQYRFTFWKTKHWYW